MNVLSRQNRAAGAVVGSAVGDALGAPFEFGAAGVYTARFPDGAGTMCGGGGWDPGEATDDTQMAVLVAESLLERGGPDLPDLFDRFRRWAAGEPKDIGLQTEDVLTSGEPWDVAAARHFQINGRAAGNGSLMRAATSAVYFARPEPAKRTADAARTEDTARAQDITRAQDTARVVTMDAARRIAALTHGDRAAWEGTAVLHELIRTALDGTDPLTAVQDALASVHADHRERWATVLAPDWHPDAATEFNGAVWPCLGTALWALRTTRSYESALATAIDVGGDTDTVAAVTGALAGAAYGFDAIPSRWTGPLHVPLPGYGGRVLRTPDLVTLARRLDDHRTDAIRTDS
ncbi:ADP-ribosylglycohydrolase family protein [Streptomyces brevispora]|uniref:ADP-ribosylglycohydrolase family protein n=1 Tax=Streptomyces brevispora TaxID=887462 RepID=A0ABZ1GC24_9ACTN|nr:ADP-ribosylglycohydrolase family protein [Streptomyces brevispora]WSC16786.1 ADP-ribosylglycohydrolase family protein [Streptomyces brevispora]